MGLLRGMARTAAVAGTATAVSNRVSRRQARRWSAKDDQQSQPDAYSETPAADYSQNPAAHPANTNEQIDQLRQLADLKDKGILTQAEFEQKKAQILNS